MPDENPMKSEIPEEKLTTIQVDPIYEPQPSLSLHMGQSPFRTLVSKPLYQANIKPFASN